MEKEPEKTASENQEKESKTAQKRIQEENEKTEEKRKEIQANRQETVQVQTQIKRIETKTGHIYIGIRKDASTVRRNKGNVKAQCMPSAHAHTSIRV